MLKPLFLRLLFVLSLLVSPLAHADAPSPPDTIEPPIPVRVSLRVTNILEIKEVAGQGRFGLEIVQHWTDPRLAFDGVAIGHQRVDRVGKEADAYLETIWTPGLSIDNLIKEKESRTVAVAVSTNGEVMLIERFEADLRFRMNMDAFPFDKQDLTISLSLPRYAKQEALLVVGDRERRLSGFEAEPSVVDWSPRRLRFVNEETMGWNARSYSKIAATLTIERQSGRYLLRIFVPILAVLAVSLFVLWSPGLKEQDKGGLIFSSLLALAAISFTFESSFPGSISLNTPVAQMISLGYLYLVLVLMLEIVLAVTSAKWSGIAGDFARQLHVQIKWALPLWMVLICAGTAYRALPD